MIFEDIRKPKLGKNTVPKSRSGSSKVSKPAEVIVKVASDIKTCNSGSSLKYIARDRKKDLEEDYLHPENERGQKLSKEELKNNIDKWDKEFRKEDNLNSRKMTHLILSVGGVKNNETNKEALEKATREFLHKRFGKEGFRYNFTIHNDTKNLHAHVVINNNNLKTGKKLRMSKHWFYETRQMKKECLNKHGIVQSASFKKDRQYLDKEFGYIERDRRNVKNWFDKKVANVARNDKHFEHLKRQQEILNKISRQRVKTSDTSQEQIDFEIKLQYLKKELSEYDHFSERKAYNNFRSFLHHAKFDIKDLKEVDKHIAKSKDEELKSKFYETKKLAKELLNIESIVKHGSLPEKEKAEILKKIQRRKKDLYKVKSLEFVKMERQFKYFFSGSQIFKREFKKYNSMETKIENILKKEKPDQKERNTDTEKNLQRLLYKFYEKNAEQKQKDIYHEQNRSEHDESPSFQLSREEKKDLQNREKDFNLFCKEKNVDLNKYKSIWDKQIELKREIANLNKSKDPTIRQVKITQLLKKIDEIEVDKHHYYKLKRSLETKQRKLNESFAPAKNKQEITKSLKYLENNFKKFEEKKHLNLKTPAELNKHRFMLTKSLIQLQKRISSDELLPNAKKELEKQAEEIEMKMKLSGFTIDKIRTKDLNTSEFSKQMDKYRNTKQFVDIPRFKENILKYPNQNKEETIMHKSFDFNRSQNNTDNIKANLKETNIPRDTKRKIKKEIDEIAKVNANIAHEKQVAFNARIKETKESFKELKELQTKSKDQNLGFAEKVILKKDINKISKSIRNDLKSLNSNIGGFKVDNNDRNNIKIKFKEFEKRLTKTMDIESSFKR